MRASARRRARGRLRTSAGGSRRRRRAELLGFRAIVDDYEHADVLRVVLARAARSARRTTHFDLEFPREPQLEPYWCYKHRRECRPVETAAQFLRRYTLDTLARLKEFARVRVARRAATVIHGDVRAEPLPGRFDGVVTSPPYPGLIDYHEQHRYAYELLGLDDRRELEVGAAAAGTSRARAGGVRGRDRAGAAERQGAPARRARRSLIVVNDRRDLYPEILDRAGLRLEERLRRHVNRRTGRRARRVLRRRADRALNRHRDVTAVPRSFSRCSRAPSPLPSSASSRGESRWRRTSRAARLR